MEEQIPVDRIEDEFGASFLRVRRASAKGRCGAEYFRLLARHNVAHVFNAWTRLPSLGEQIAMPEAFTADFTVVRALLQKGRGYEKAVSMFEPSSEVKDPDEATRDALREIVKQSLRTRAARPSTSTTVWKGTPRRRSRPSQRLEAASGNQG